MERTVLFLFCIGRYRAYRRSKQSVNLTISLMLRKAKIEENVKRRKTIVCQTVKSECSSQFTTTHTEESENSK